MSRIQKIIGAFSLVAVFALIPSPVFAAKARTSRQSASSSTAAGGYNTSVRFRADRRAIFLTLAGLNQAKSVSYELSYLTEGAMQGAIGTITQTANSTSRELLFGTCSKGVCRYHTNIQNAKIVVTAKMKSGQTRIKTFRLKV